MTARESHLIAPGRGRMTIRIVHNSGSPTVYTVGHSIQDSARLIELLRRHDVHFLVDVRSLPHSHRAPQFSQGSLMATLSDAAIAYRFLGESLGGRPEGNEFYDEYGYVLYDRVATSQRFLAGLKA